MIQYKWLLIISISFVLLLSGCASIDSRYPSIRYLNDMSESLVSLTPEPTNELPIFATTPGENPSSSLEYNIQTIGDISIGVFIAMDTEKGGVYNNNYRVNFFIENRSDSIKTIHPKISLIYPNSLQSYPNVASFLNPIFDIAQISPKDAGLSPKFRVKDTHSGTYTDAYGNVIGHYKEDYNLQDLQLDILDYRIQQMEYDAKVREVETVRRNREYAIRFISSVKENWIKDNYVIHPYTKCAGFVFFQNSQNNAYPISIIFEINGVIFKFKSAEWEFHWKIKLQNSNKIINGCPINYTYYEGLNWMLSDFSKVRIKIEDIDTIYYNTDSIPLQGTYDERYNMLKSIESFLINNDVKSANKK